VDKTYLPLAGRVGERVVTGGRWLTPEQEAAVTALEGPCRLVAGAGTGKTAVIVERVRRLLQNGVDPSSILVMTFSERAAEQLRERVQLASGCDLPGLGTFHAQALRWLREHREGGLPAHFEILAGAERWIFLRELMWELGNPAFVASERPDDLVTPLLKLQERLKQELVPIPNLEAWARRLKDAERRSLYLAAVQLFESHSILMHQRALADFDDLLLRSVRLLEREPRMRSRMQARYRWILVDEYQDCNAAQERLVELLGAPDGNVCVVGDDDQSIYRFRGASRASMERFQALFPSARTLMLAVNQRSSTAIVSSGRTLIEHDPRRLAKPLRSGSGESEAAQVEVWECDDGEVEAQALAEHAFWLASRGIDLREIAVLSRSHAIALPVLSALDKLGVPAQHWAGRGFFRRPEIQDLIAYLRLLHDPLDLHALARLLARPPLGLDLEVALALARSQPAAENQAWSPLTQLLSWEPAAPWARLVLELIPLKHQVGVDELLFEILARSQHLAAILPGSGPERERILARVEQFVELTEAYCARRRDHSLAPFVQHLELVLRSGLEEPTAAGEVQEAVQVMSIHQAKGLEFEAVLVPALVEGRLPQPHRSPDLDLPAGLAEAEVRGRADHLAEERRLLYVAMTRARKQVVLAWAPKYEGRRRWRRSRFLDELGDDLKGRQVHASMAVAEQQDPGPGLSAMPAEAPPGKLSFTAITAYQECPRQFWFRQRVRLPPAPTVEAQLGIVIHAALLQAGKLRQEGRELAEGELHHLYQEAWAEVALVEPRRRPVLEKAGWELLRSFWAEGGLAAAPWLLEHPFNVNLGKWELHGVIDRVDRLADSGGWKIIDYKTGKPSSLGRGRRDLQLGLYALAASQGLGLESLELEVVYLRNREKAKVEMDAGLLAAARAAGEEVAEGIRRGEFQPRPEGRRCRHCPYRLACDAAV
jgi:DNA helicase II / ATP-dependent DNA helicase PcrA